MSPSRRTAFKLALGVLGAVLLVPLLGTLALSWMFGDFGSGMCGGKIYSSAKSPDGVLVAYAFERDCGATTGFASFVIVRPAAQKLVLSQDLVSSEIVFSTEGDFKPALKWVSRDELRVSFDYGSGVPSKSEIQNQVLVYSGIRIRYQGLQP